MDLDEFGSCTARYWNAYFTQISIGRSPLGGGSWLFPSEIVVAELDGYLYFELIGTVREFQQLRVAKARGTTVDNYLWQFHGDTDTESSALFTYEAVTQTGLSGLVLTSADRQARAAKRYPGLTPLFDSNQLTVLVRAEGQEGPLITVRTGCNDIHLSDLVLLNESRGKVRFRRILVGGIYSVDCSRQELFQRLRTAYPFDGPQFFGLLPRTTNFDQAMLEASQLVSRYSTPGLLEVDISAFLRDHSQLLKSTFGYVDLVYEPLLEWQQDKPRDVLESYNPDFMARRLDGYWDIIELKLPLLDQAKLTRGAGSTTRFMASPYQAISQLAHYASYFDVPENAAWAREKYGVQVDKPRRIAIVGTSENADVEDIKRALITAPADTEVIDYDSLVQSYLFAQTHL